MQRFRLRLRKFVRRFVRHEGAATVVEFALLALPFFALIFGILELGFIFLVSTTLENAITISGRRIRTGELQGSADSTAGAFKNSICANMTWLSSTCASNLNVDVRTYTSFNNITPPDPVVNGVLNTALPFTPGGPSDIVVVRAYYSWTIVTPLLNATLVNLGSNRSLISATVAFRNEPYTP